MLKLKFQSFGHLMGRVLWKRPRSWEKLKAGGEGEDRTWDGWMASLTQCTWVWANSGRSWRTGKPGVLQSMGSQRVRHNWVTELKWTEGSLACYSPKESQRVRHDWETELNFSPGSRVAYSQAQSFPSLIYGWKDPMCNSCTDKLPGHVGVNMLAPIGSSPLLWSECLCPPGIHMLKSYHRCHSIRR